MKKLRRSVMKKFKSILLLLLLVISLTLSGCSELTSSTSPKNTDTTVDQTKDKISTPITAPEETPEFIGATFDFNSIPEYSGEAFIAVNNNVPFFSVIDRGNTESFETYSDLDHSSRCGVAFANVEPSLMPTESRGKIGSVKPSGWQSVKYDSVNGNYLYNRCHLIGFQLSGENANEKNLITGTRSLNIEGMLPFENMVADFVKETKQHVLYRVTPIFENTDLLARGVLMEAYSVEDAGAGIHFCVYAYNVQPGITIEYSNGESSLTTVAVIPEPAPAPTPIAPPIEVVNPPAPEFPPKEYTYILNTSTKKFHLPTCHSVNQMKDNNKSTFTGNREELIKQGYSPCKNCKP